MTKRFRFEKGADGKPQAVIPGAEPLTAAEINRRKLLRKQLGSCVARVPQKPCDVGLFADDVDQIDLESWLNEQSEN